MRTHELAKLDLIDGRSCLQFVYIGVRAASFLLCFLVVGWVFGGVGLYSGLKGIVGILEYFKLFAFGDLGVSGLVGKDRVVVEVLFYFYRFSVFSFIFGGLSFLV